MARDPFVWLMQRKQVMAEEMWRRNFRTVLKLVALWALVAYTVLSSHL